MKKQHSVSFVALSLLLGVFTSTHAMPVTLEFSGALADGSSVSGTFTYDNAATPLATNVRGLGRNATYALSAWTFTVTPRFLGLPPIMFTNSGARDSVEFCLGHCAMDAQTLTNLTFTTFVNTPRVEKVRMQLSFDPLVDPTPFTSPPTDVSEWGGINPKSLRSSFLSAEDGSGGVVVVILFQGGALAAAQSSNPPQGPCR